MIVKTIEGCSHTEDLEDVLQSVRKYDMRINSTKCSFGVQARKFMGFMLTQRDIEVNFDKCQTFIMMRSPTSVKEDQELKCCLASLSRFLSCAGDKGFLFFSALKNNVMFEWNPSAKCLSPKSRTSSQHHLSWVARERGLNYYSFFRSLIRRWD